jgi:glucose/mannose-6-phosphate isomerase
MSDALTALLDGLDDPARFATLDSMDMLGLVRKFPAQCREAVAIGATVAPSSSAQAEIRQVVMTGLGGSAIGGDFARALMDEYGTVPMVVNRDYTLPHYLNAHTLLVAASYSGNTEETLSAYALAKRAGAQISVVTSGGALGEKATADGYPVARVPGGQPPRSATGYMFFPLLGYLTANRLLERDLTPDIQETLALLERMEATFRPEVPTAQNLAKQTAGALYGKLPVIYGSQGYRGAVAVRWKGQFNENTKIAAFANVLPEQNHNEILAWTQAQRQAQTWSVLFLRDADESERIARRVEVTKSLLGAEVSVHEFYAEGESLLARMFSLIYLADFITVYLAYLYGVCPTQIGAIDHLKAELAQLA